MSDPVERSTARRLALGLDIGGTKLAAGVVADDGEVLSWLRMPSGVEDGPDAVIARQIGLGRAAVREAGVPWDDVPVVGIGCGGPLDPERGIILAPLHLPGWHDVPLVAMVERELRRPAVVDNDATAAALAEWRYGAGRRRGVRSLVYMTISTGVGGGLVLDGQVYRGAAGNAGELGHLTVDWHGRLCQCGRRGCLEAYASGTNIAVRAREALARQALEQGTASALAGLAQVTARDVAEAAAAGDPLAREVWNETTAILGSAMATILDVFNPELIVLGGGVTRAGDQLLRPVREQGLGQALGPAARSGDIVLAELGDQVGVVAAAAIAFERLGDRFPAGSALGRAGDAAPPAGAGNDPAPATHGGGRG
jgi:glucokinase